MNTETRKMLRHVVLLQFKDEASQEQIRDISQAFRALPAQIAAIVRLEWKNIITEGAPYSSRLIVTCHSEADLKAYENHPAHQAIPATFGSVMRTLAVTDYWVNP